MFSRLTPKWILQMPFGHVITPIYVVSQLVAAVGVGCLVAGIAGLRADQIMAGLVALVPFLFLLFLLWRTHLDDGYRG